MQGGTVVGSAAYGLDALLPEHRNLNLSGAIEGPLGNLNMSGLDLSGTSTGSALIRDTKVLVTVQASDGPETRAISGTLTRNYAEAIMSQIALETTEPDAERIKAEVDSLFAQMRLLNEQNQRTDERIARLRADSRAISQETDAILEPC